MENDKLQRQKSDLAVTNKTLIKESAKILADELHLAALNAKSWLEPEMAREFSRAFADYPTAAIQFAFRKWREESPFFPAISDIRQLLALWRRAQADVEASREQAKVREARGRGELIDFANIVKDLKEKSKSIPESPTSVRIREVREQAEALANNPPPMRLTREQIEARKAAEQAEIEKYSSQ